MAIKHLEEFEIYYGLGTKRSYRETAEILGKSNRTVEKWGVEEGWTDEVKLRDLEVLKEQRKEAVKKRKEKASQYQQIITHSLNVYIDNLKKGKIKMDSTADLDRLVRLSCYLDGYIDEAYAIQTGETEDAVNSTVEGLNTELSKKTLETMNQIISSFKNLKKSKD